ncbi:hypothetical protein Curi_c22820 [Gottschalkia acidurici 9a]|uniref:Uncharacterized protein n=1 Tax=Gottschalkia acidurici (strain ATCC 7906 / DSM 604 / BCRC 14475 / CIP 104303 / KCTC 5404 / NCIMB 10678 / 9a) TaxID=1128398 RepID=K0B1A6_GOTA9|nr:hypothetical protein [Gottschalkia acidurici]AFS79284.1 hypothetical protein Curi_c22820 [Gottschalkia acidurici 9a]
MGRGGTRISARELKLEIESLKNMISRKSKKNNEINDLIIGRLDKSILEKLRGWGESK